MTQRAASRVIVPIPRSPAVAAQLASSSRRHGWLRHAVQARVSERTRSGWLRARIWLIAPPIDAPITWAVSTPAWSSTAIASSAIWASE